MQRKSVGFSSTTVNTMEISFVYIVLTITFFLTFIGAVFAGV
jgi:hypothetical protein